MPYFYTDQFDLGCEYIGHASAEDEVVVRGDLAKREFMAFWLDAEDHLLAVMNVNVWDVIDKIKPLIAAKTVVSREKLADGDVPFNQVGA